ncbi:MAG: hypothetical protein NTY19_27375, partial [Planctomycetota bacterium]|nr:hypothetical protein [Planctomycetota bacterium]
HVGPGCRDLLGVGAAASRRKLPSSVAHAAKDRERNNCRKNVVISLREMTCHHAERDGYFEDPTQIHFAILSR